MNTTNPHFPPQHPRSKSKTLAAWLAVLGGPLGAHRFYLYGPQDIWAWLHPLPTALGLWGFVRLQQFGQDDVLSWWLLPCLGLSIATACLFAILYGLTDPAHWNTHHNPHLQTSASAGHTRWLTVGAVVCALMVGAIALMSSLAFGFQRYFEHQVEQGLLISQ